MVNDLPPVHPSNHPYEIDITKRGVELPASEVWIEHVLALVLTQHHKKTARISVVFVSDAEIHRMNRQFLGHDYPTDVISFSLADDPPDIAKPDDFGPISLHEIDAELVISVETAIAVAHEVGWSPACELLLYCIHGSLHLCGYEDDTETDAAEMRKAEQAIFRLCELPQPPPLIHHAPDHQTKKL